MIDNMQGPDKGLLDILFGKTPDAAQAGVPASASGEALQQTPEEFTQVLAKAQDQKDSKTVAQKLAAGSLPKGGQQQTVSQSVTDAATEAKQKATAAMSGGAVKGAKTVASEKKAEGEAKAAKAVETKKTTAQAETSAQAQAQAQAQAMAAQAQSAMTKPVAKSEAQAKVQAAAGKAQAEQQQQLQGMAGPKALGTAAKQAQADGMAQALRQKQQQQQSQAKSQISPEIQAAITAAQQAAVTAQQAAVTAQQAAVSAQQQNVAAQHAQPVVMALPMAAMMPMQVELVEVDSGAQAPGQASGAQNALARNAHSTHGPVMQHSQDFLALHGGEAMKAAANRLGIDRVDPRLGNRLNDERKAAGDSATGAEAGMASLIPQLGGQYGQAYAGSEAVMAGAPMQVQRGSTNRLELANSASLASDIRSVAARGGGAIKVRVMPENLGELTIHVSSSKDQKLNVRFEAQSNEAREALNNSMAELKQMLNASRYDIGSIEVDRSTSAAVLQAGSSQMGQWDQSGHRSGDHSQQQGSAWDRYFAKQDAQDQSQYGSGRGNSQSGYRRYQQQYELGA